jgi:hypothetical protein
MVETTEPTDATLAAEHEEATSRHVADRPPTTDEAAAAKRGPEAAGMDPDSVKEHFEEMADLGAHVKGEGEIE